MSNQEFKLCRGTDKDKANLVIGSRNTDGTHEDLHGEYAGPLARKARQIWHRKKGTQGLNTLGRGRQLDTEGHIRERE